MTNTEGTDISGYQPPAPDFTGDQYAIIKVDEGIGIVNPNYQAQLAKARAEGLAIGHYGYQDKGNPVGQANDFMNRADIRPGEIVMQDIEGDLLTTNDPVAEAVAYADAIIARGEIPVSYMSEATEAAWDWTPLVNRGCALAMAAYNNTGPGQPKHWPFVTIWQHSDTNASGGDSDTFYNGNQDFLTVWHKIADPTRITARPVTPPKPVTPPAPPAPAPNTYTVRAGDTYSGIAASHGVALAALETANPGVNYNLIHPGDVVHLPHGGTPAPAVRVYTVAPGDTLSGIAVHLGVTLDHLVVENRINNPDLIYPGEHFTY